MLELIHESNKWDQKKLASTANKAICSTLGYLNLDPNQFDVAILACDDKKIQQLNAEFRGIDEKTNILSWPESDLSSKVAGVMPSKPKPIGHSNLFLGNLAISYGFIAKEVKKLDKDFYHHVYHLITHGTLHLLGFGHDLELDAKIMENIEIELLAKVGISDPYVIGKL